MSEAALIDVAVTEEEYLAGEEQTPLKHEYLAGWIYAMSGASTAHNVIERNLGGILYSQLRGKRCQSFGSNMKVRLERPGATYYYYPDAMVCCDPTDLGEGIRERPAAIFEIISESTRRTDEREKRMNYHALSSLEAYVRIEQKRAEVVFEHRTHEGWKIGRLVGLESDPQLPSLGIAFSLADLYEGVSFPPERLEEDLR